MAAVYFANVAHRVKRVILQGAAALAGGGILGVGLTALRFKARSRAMHHDRDFFIAAGDTPKLATNKAFKAYGIFEVFPPIRTGIPVERRSDGTTVTTIPPRNDTPDNPDGMDGFGCGVGPSCLDLLFGTCVFTILFCLVYMGAMYLGGYHKDNKKN